MVASISVVLEVTAESHFKCEKLRYVMLCYAELFLPPLSRPDWRLYASRKFAHRRVP